jgi:hypothetical protein
MRFVQEKESPGLGDDSAMPVSLPGWRFKLAPDALSSKCFFARATSAWGFFTPPAAHNV